MRRLLLIPMLVVFALPLAGSETLVGKNPFRPYVISLLLERGSRPGTLAELPETYLGAWGYGSDSTDYLCIVQNQSNEITVYSEPSGHYWWTGFSFSVDGQVYAYVIAKWINLATGRIIHFSSESSSHTIEYLDLDVLLESLKAEQLTFRETPHNDQAVVVVDFAVLKQALSSESLSFSNKPLVAAPLRTKLSNENKCFGHWSERPPN